jgi:glycine cleavage system regulatory protein
MTHDDFHFQMNAYLAGGLTDAERAAVAAHAAACPACAAAMEQAEAADRELDELFAAARPGDGLEDRVIGRLRAVRRPPMVLHPMVRRAAVGVAAAILLGGVGFAVTQAEQDGSSLFSFLDPEPDPAADAGQASADVTGDDRAPQATFYDRFGVDTPADIARRLADEVGVPAAGSGSGSGGGAGENGRVRRVQQEVAYRFDSAIASAERRIAEGRAEDFGAARAALDQARLARASNMTVIPPDQLSAWDDRVRQTELTLAEAERRAEDGESGQAARRIKASIAGQERDALHAREATLEDLVRTSQRLSAEGRYVDALGVVDQIAVIDPGNKYAKGARPLVEQRANQSERLSVAMTDGLDRAGDGSTPALPQPPNVGTMFRRHVHGREAVVMNDPDFKPDENRSRARAAGEAPEEETRLMGERLSEAEAAGPDAKALGTTVAGVRFGDQVADGEAARVEVRSEGEAGPALEALKEVEQLATGVESLSKQQAPAGAAWAERYYNAPANSAGDMFVAGKPVDVRLGYSVDAKGTTAAGETAVTEANARFDPGAFYAKAVGGEGFEEKTVGEADRANSQWHARFGNQPAGAGGPAAEAGVSLGRLGDQERWDKASGARDARGLADLPGSSEAKSDAVAAKVKAAPADGGRDFDSDDFYSPNLGSNAAGAEGKPGEKAMKDGTAGPADAAGQAESAAQAESGRPLARSDFSAGFEFEVAQRGDAQAPAAADAAVADAAPAEGAEAAEPGTDPTAHPIVPGQPAQPPADPAAQPAPPPQTPDQVQQAQRATQNARQIIRNGDMTFDVDGYDSAVVQITKIAAEEGGHVATTESEKLPNGKVKGSVVVRVPPERLDTLVLKLRGLGDLKHSRISAQDVTKQFTDLAAQLRAALTMEKRLLEIIEGGKGEVKDLLEAEKQLGTWRERIERLQGEINYYKDLVALSTLTVTLVERDIRTAALLSESEQVNMGIEATDVEQARAEAIKAVADAKGRIVESDLKTHDAGQYSATITAEVAPDAAGPVIDRLKQVGRVSRLEVQRRLATAEGAPPAPGARLERKDTRLQLSIYNLANVAPRNTTTLNLAAEDVEKAYRAVLEQVTSAGGRVVNSQLTKPTVEQTTGTVVFEAPAEAADVLLGAVRGAGEVMRLDSTTNPDTQNSTDAKRGFSVQIQSLATVPPRESTTLRVAARDVAGAFNALREAVRGAGGRILTSQLAEQEGGAANVTGQLDFEVRRADYAAVEAALGGAGVVLSRNVSRSADAQNTVDSKVLLQVAFVDERTVPPRETVTTSLAVDDVATKYEALLDALRDMGGGAAGGGARVLVSNINQQDPNDTTATVEFDVRRADRAAADKLLADAGAVYGRTVSRPAEGQPALDEKVRLSVTLHDVDNLAPRETTTLGLEVTDVHGTVGTIEATAIALGGRKVDSDWAQDADGRNVARVVVDVPLAKASELLDRAQRSGRVLTIQREQTPSAPEGTFSRGRLSVTIATADPIVQRDQGLAASVKSGLSTSVYWLLQSVKLIVVGLCLVAPWAIILWLAWRLVRRNRERRRRAGLSGPTPPPGGPAASPAV